MYITRTLIIFYSQKSNIKIRPYPANSPREPW